MINTTIYTHRASINVSDSQVKLSLAETFIEAR